MLQQTSYRLLAALAPQLQGQAAGCSLLVARGMSQFALQNKGLKAGPGGRSSVSGVTATVFGATGFIGKYVVNELAKKGSRVVCPFRSVEEKTQALKQMGDLGQVVLLKDFSIRDDEAVKYAISKSNVVINLIGAESPTRNFSFDEVHTQWPARLAKFVAESPLAERMIHFSALGADLQHPGARLRTKALGDAAVLEAYPNATILRPGAVVGEEDNFFNNFVFQCKFNPTVPLIDGGRSKLQPTYVIDVAQAVMVALEQADSAGKTFHLGGPQVMSVKEIVDLIYETLQEGDEETINIPSSLALMALKPLDYISRYVPIKNNYMFTADFVEELAADNIVPEGVLTYDDLGIYPQKVTEGMAIEPVRHCRVGGYKLGDTDAIAKKLPRHIRKYFGMETIENSK